MFDLIYNFLFNFIFNSEIISATQRENISTLATLCVLALIIAVLIKLVVWVFNIPFNFRGWRK